MGGRERLELKSPLHRGFFCLARSLHGRSVASVAALPPSVALRAHATGSRVAALLSSAAFQQHKKTPLTSEQGLSFGCYGSLSTIDGLHHTAVQSELFHQGGKLNHGFLTLVVTAAATIDREIILSCVDSQTIKKAA